MSAKLLGLLLLTLVAGLSADGAGSFAGPLSARRDRDALGTSIP